VAFTEHKKNKKYMLEKLNNKIVENPSLVWGVSFLVWALSAVIFGRSLGKLLDFDFSYVFVFLFWFIHPYICYILARSKNRSGLLWALLGAWFFVFAILVLNRLPRSLDGVY